MSIRERQSLRFGSLTIEYDERVLEPRPWVALQSRWAAELAVDDPSLPILELCTGAGHIGLLAASLAGTRLVAVDVDPAACYFARLNAQGAGLEHRVEVREAPLEEALRDGEMFRVVVADPPWVTSDSVGRFPEDPLLAIDGGVDGLRVARACVEACRDHVVSNGRLLVQLGDRRQAAALIAEADPSGWSAGELRSGARGVVQELVRR